MHRYMIGYGTGIWRGLLLRLKTLMSDDIEQPAWWFSLVRRVA